MKILCSGNPEKPTIIASAIKQQFPQAEFASRLTGYDLRLWSPRTEEYFKNQIKNYTVFINSSFICAGAQAKLLKTTHCKCLKY
jgi:hypothetical protein